MPAAREQVTPARPPRGPCPAPSCGNPDGLQLHVLVQPAHSATLATEPAQLEAAERGVTGTHPVDRDLTGADAAGDADGPVHVTAPDRAGEPVARVVRDRYRVVLVAVAQ